MELQSATPNSDPVDICQFDHTPFYCEENVYWLCKKLCSSGKLEESDLFVIFISNDKKQVPLWHQKASRRTDGVVLWDYHVICIQKKKDGSPHLVWDLDSNLPFPCQLDVYVAETIRPSFQLFSMYQRFFRVVHAPNYLCSFASDRRHMRDSAGNWIEYPPPSDPIVAQDGTLHNLNEYMEIKGEEVATNLKDGLLDKVYSQKLGLVVRESHLEELICQAEPSVEGSAPSIPYISNQIKLPVRRRETWPHLESQKKDDR
ncbi:hypothetical protein V2J09_014441 [Rumex salicifolius]